MNLLLIEITTEQLTAAIAGLVAGIVALASVAAALGKLRTGVWNPFSKGFLAPRRARRLKLAVVADMFDEVVATVKRIEAEVTPNGGSSLKDTIDRIDRKTEHLQARARHHDNHSTKPIFELDNFGNLIFANAAMYEALEADIDDLKKRNWIARVGARERQAVVADLRLAIENKMPFDTVVRFNSPRGLIAMHLKADPYVRSGSELVGFFGSAERLSGNGR